MRGLRSTLQNRAVNRVANGSNDASVGQTNSVGYRTRLLRLRTLLAILVRPGERWLPFKCGRKANSSRSTRRSSSEKGSEFSPKRCWRASLKMPTVPEVDAARKDYLQCNQRGLTPAQAERQRQAPGPAGGTRYIFTGPGLASCRRRPLSSNVRPREVAPPV